MMKIRDFVCLLAGVALLLLAFQLKGFAEEARPSAAPTQETAAAFSLEMADCLKESLTR